MNSRLCAFWTGNLILLSVSAHLSAQVLTTEHNMPHYSDSLEVYKLPGFAVTDAGRNCEWDFSHLPIDSATYVPVDHYMFCCDTMHIGIHREHANYYTLYAADTIWEIGYETSHASMYYSSPVPRLCFPFRYDDSIVCTIAGSGQYCHSVPLSTEGKAKVHVDATGKLILPDLTVDSVIRLYSIVQHQEQTYRKTQVLEERYQWYSVYCRYPLLENIKVLTIANKDTIYVASSYYFPQEQEDMPEEPKRLEKSVESMDSLITDAHYLPNPVISDLRVGYNLIRGAQVYISLHYNGGVSVYQTPMHYEEEGNYSVLVNMAGMPTGNYVVYIHADETIVSGNIIKL